MHAIVRAKCKHSCGGAKTSAATTTTTATAHLSQECVCVYYTRAICPCVLTRNTCAARLARSPSSPSMGPSHSFQFHFDHDERHKCAEPSHSTIRPSARASKTPSRPVAHRVESSLLKLLFAPRKRTSTCAARFRVRCGRSRSHR